VPCLTEAGPGRAGPLVRRPARGPGPPAVACAARRGGAWPLAAVGPCPAWCRVMTGLRATWAVLRCLIVVPFS